MSSLKERFESKFIPEPNSGCWLWEASLTRGGYGQIRDKSKMRRCNRVSYELYKGEIPEGKHVLHTCDNPLCVNPSHLFLGTIKDNNLDKVRKGRHKWGTKKGHKTLSFEIAQEIRKYYIENKCTQIEVARTFGISGQQICRIINNQIWRKSAKVG